MLIRFTDHKFYSQVLQDGEILKKHIPEDKWAIEFFPEFDEYEYYIHTVGFSLVNFMHFCDQLDFVVDYLSMFDYQKAKLKDRPNRIDFLVYNIENYFIRFQSIQDRLLQLINSVFHLCIHEGKVNYDIIITNIKVQRTDVPSKIKILKKIINNFTEKRNQVIHRSSFREIQLHKLEMFYLADLDSNNEGDKLFKNYRSRELADYINIKKQDFKEYNEKLFRTIPPLLDELNKEYDKQKTRLR